MKGHDHLPADASAVPESHMARSPRLFGLPHGGLFPARGVRSRGELGNIFDKMSILLENLPQMAGSGAPLDGNRFSVLHLDPDRITYESQILMFNRKWIDHNTS